MQYLRTKEVGDTFQNSMTFVLLLIYSCVLHKNGERVMSLRTLSYLPTPSKGNIR